MGMIAPHALDSGLVCIERLLVRWCSIEMLVDPQADRLTLSMLKFPYGATIWTAPIGV